MKISVIIPAYNGEKWIAQCIENVLGQTFRDLEIIVVDDGSRDRTAEIASRYEVRVISQPNQGLSVSRNVGAAAARGEWIHFLDVDDLICRDYYERMMAAVEPAAEVSGAAGAAAAAGTIDMVFGDFLNEAFPRFSLSYGERMTLVALEDKISVTNAAVMAYAWRYMIRREFFETAELQFEPGRLVEDLPFVLTAIERSRTITTAPGAMYRYMRREGSIINSRDCAHRRKLAAHLSHVRALRREFFDRHGLGPVYRPRVTYQYKFLGIPLVRKVELNHGKNRWYILGVRVLQKKCV